MSGEVWLVVNVKMNGNTEAVSERETPTGKQNTGAVLLILLQLLNPAQECEEHQDCSHDHSTYLCVLGKNLKHVSVKTKLKKGK